MSCRGSRYVTCASLAGALFCAAPAHADPIVQAFPFAIRDNESSNTIGTGVGQTFSIGVSNVVPDGLQGTSATATNDATGSFENLQNFAGDGRPGLFGVEFSHAAAQSAGLLGSWTITLENGGDSLTLSTPDRTSTQAMKFADQLAIAGPATAPTVTWDLPAGGPTVSQVRYELWNDETNQIISGQSPVNLGSGATSVSLSGLSPGTDYAIRIILQHNDALGRSETRSSNWISWTAEDGAAAGNVVRLTAGSPATLTQDVDIPNDPFNLTFDYRFTTSTGALSVLLGGQLIGRVLEASAFTSSDFLRAVFEIDDPALLGATGQPLTFQIDGPTGSSVLLDNVVFPGIFDGSFESLTNWTAGGPGVVALTRIPEPGSGPLAVAGLLLLGLCFALMGAGNAARHSKSSKTPVNSLEL